MKSINKTATEDSVDMLLAGSGAAHHEQISKIVDEHIAWMQSFARAALTASDAKRQLAKVRAFAAWYRTAPQQLPYEQPLIDRLAVLHDQLHKAAAHAVDKAGNAPLDPEIYDHVCGCYNNFMQPLRAFEKSFNALTHGVDHHTGLRSRYRIIDDLSAEQKAIARGGSTLAIAIGSIDQYGEINTLHGVETGDRALAGAADCILKTLRAYDVAYRLGNNTFLLCLKRTTLEDTITAIKRLQTCLAETQVRLFGGSNLTYTVSFAVASLHADTDIPSLLRGTEGALFTAQRVDGQGALATA